jgi:hypothetical protein
MVEGLSVGQFRRGLRQEALLCLENLTTAQGDNWWKDLLRLWTPSGCGDGLRLAVRFNTLDFYYKGSCVAHISFSPGKRNIPAPARVTCHVQFIFEDRMLGQKQALFDPERGLWKHNKTTRVRKFDDIIAYIRLWQDKPTQTAKRRKAPEKPGVDAIIGNSGNVIDLEMALPAWDRKKDSALRMDLVSLERDGDRIQIAFWEAKTFDDGRLRSEEGLPEVIGQLLGNSESPGYVEYVKHADHETNIRSAYAETCVILDRLHKMKCSLMSGNSAPMSPHPLIAEVARLAKEEIPNRLFVKSQLGLVIFSDREDKVIRNDIYWRPHREAIHGTGITILEQQNSKDITLPVVPRT